MSIDNLKTFKIDSNISLNTKSKNIILISENELNDLKETLFLSIIPGYVKNINKIRKNEDWSIAKEYNPNEAWWYYKKVIIYKFSL